MSVEDYKQLPAPNLNEWSVSREKINLLNIKVQHLTEEINSGAKKDIDLLVFTLFDADSSKELDLKVQEQFVDLVEDRLIKAKRTLIGKGG